MSSAAFVEGIRRHFPALERRWNGRPVAYFDGPGGTQVPGAVAKAMAEYLFQHNANTHWNYPASEETDRLLAEAREHFAAFVAGAPDEISFGNNMTTITFHLARTLARQWPAGSEVIVTELDHHGNVAPWQAIARDFGVVLRWLPLDLDTMRLRLDLLPDLLNSRTRLLAIGAASNIVGTISDVCHAAALAHAAGALVFVDGVHYAPHVLPDVAALGCDFFVCSAYKFYGPHLGILWGKRRVLDNLDPPRLDPAPQDSPEKFETGTQNHEGIVAADAALSWLASLADGGDGLRSRLSTVYDTVGRHERALIDRLENGLREIPGITLHVPSAGPRTATVSFSLADQSPSVIARAFAEAGCFVSHGDFYAATVVQRLGRAPDGVVRIGAACYNTESEIDRLLDVLRNM